MTAHERRPCPVCGRTVSTTREPVNDDRIELIAYNRHEDTIGNPCPMSGQRAAARAVGVTPQRWEISA